MTSKKALSKILQDLIEGNLEKISTVFNSTQQELQNARESLNTYSLSKEALLKVLYDFQISRVSSNQVQKWASFMRWGIIPSSSTEPVKPLEIGYSSNYEDEIIEVLAKLDELGDIVDGEINLLDIKDLQNLLTR